MTSAPTCTPSPRKTPGKYPTLRDMSGERAETFLRLLAEAELRDQLAPDPPPWAGGPARAGSRCTWRDRP